MILTGLILAGCNSPPPNGAPAQYPEVSDVRWVVPSNVPADMGLYASNNNLGMHLYHDRLYMAFRSAPTHFASKKTILYVMSSPDLGNTWTFEKKITLGTDIREPSMIVMNDQLILHYVELGHNPLAFEPKQIWQMVKNGDTWGEPVVSTLPKTLMPWEVKERNGYAWMSSYMGTHYSTSNASSVSVYFKKSADGINWEDVKPESPVLYQGGISEIGWEFDAQGNMWAVGRNEDGDASGFGNHFFTGKANDLGTWETTEKSDPYRYDSPHMFRHGNDIYMIARRSIKYFDKKDDVNGFATQPYGVNLPESIDIGTRRALYLAEYSLLPKRTAIYKIDQENKKVIWLKDLPSTGDTAFPSIVQLSEHKFLIANYSNPIVKKFPFLNTLHWDWLRGQLSQRYGTQIYLATLSFPEN